jgi:hypothetical protein
LPAKIPEYLAMGKPVVTFDVGVGELLQEGRDALFTRTGEPSELAAQIDKILQDPALAVRLGQGARQRAEELFSWDRNTDDLARFYEQILGAPPKEPSKKKMGPPERYPLSERRHLDQFLARIRHGLRLYGLIGFLKRGLRKLFKSR